MDRGSAESFGPVSGFCQSRSSDCGSDHQFSVGLGQCTGVSSANVSLPWFPERDFLLTRRIYMYSSIDSLTEMTSRNLEHGSCMVTHGSVNGGNAK